MAEGRSTVARTRIATSDATSVRVAGRDLVRELIGECSYSQMLYLLTCGRLPTADELAVLDACLVTLMEHGFNPSTLVARLMAHSVPGEPQVAIASGLLAVGGVFAGTTEQCAGMLVSLAARVDAGAEPAAVLSDFAVSRVLGSQPIPGFGHATHRPDDPRSGKLFTVAERHGGLGRHARLLQQLAVQVDAAMGRHLTINATGAIGALLLDIGVPVEAMRGFAVASRAGGLVGHLLEESRSPSARVIWDAARAAVPYEEPPGTC
ncbi:citryl-CoA lyase [Ramlibacter sp. AW1]|uniref:citrate synthase (unknown stereospecificity) n=1 Tax=Ramlibacter aurantiacus TaxID=2801330 RepID=A0A936ZM19_9BURK|nr:citryl-CoA lyase [Ramlibacter aurantiacus]MBL0422668.1 citryl-CoA lyase [Ramlibacter aurantiacus]